MLNKFLFMLIRKRVGLGVGGVDINRMQKSYLYLTQLIRTPS